MTRNQWQFRPQVRLLEERLPPASLEVPGSDSPFNLAAHTAVADDGPGPVFVGDVSWNFDRNPGPLPNPLPGPPPEWSLVGSAGTLSGHLTVVQVNPTRENATFTLTGFQGSLRLFGPDVVNLGLGFSEIDLQTTQPTDVRVELHYGSGPSKPSWKFEADHPVAVIGDGNVIGAIQSAQVVGGRVIFMR